jgi:hypothetical protein
MRTPDSNVAARRSLYFAAVHGLPRGLIAGSTPTTGAGFVDAQETSGDERDV